MRILHGPVMQIPLDIQARRHAGRRRLEYESAHLHAIDVDAGNARAGAALLAGRGRADRPPDDVGGSDVEALDVHVPRKQRQGRPVQRNAVGRHPHALRVAQPETRDLDVGREAAAESRDAHMSRCELRGLALDESATLSAVADDDQRYDAEQHEAQQTAQTQRRDAQPLGHQNACPRPM
jgi:hypothetical protein